MSKSQNDPISTNQPHNPPETHFQILFVSSQYCLDRVFLFTVKVFFLTEGIEIFKLLWLYFGVVVLSCIICLFLNIFNVMWKNACVSEKDKHRARYVITPVCDL